MNSFTAIIYEWFCSLTATVYVRMVLSLVLDIELIDILWILVVELINNLHKSALWIVILIKLIVTIYIFQYVFKIWEVNLIV